MGNTIADMLLVVDEVGALPWIALAFALGAAAYLVRRFARR
jgi:hypothetical protein